jgi:metal iron transporter
MNCPVRTDPLPDEGHNQNPPAFAAELTTNNCLNHRANDTRARNAARIDLVDGSHDSIDPTGEQLEEELGEEKDKIDVPIEEAEQEMAGKQDNMDIEVVPMGSGSLGDSNSKKSWKDASLASVRKVRSVLVKYAKFVGPGILISVAYIDPGMNSRQHYV